MYNSRQEKSIMGALLLGAAIGATVGILFAPEKGKRTRQRIIDNGDDLTQAVQHKYDQFVSFIDDVKRDIVTVKNKTEAFAAEAKNKMDSIHSS